MKKVIGALICAAICWGQAPERMTLEQAEKIAAKNHPAVDAALLAALAANQVTIEVRAAHFPSLFGSVTAAGAMDGTRLAAGGLNNPVIYNRIASGFTAGQMLTDFGRTSNLVAQANERAAARRDDAQATRAQIVLQVDRAYFAALRSRGVLTVAQQTVKARQVVVDQVTALAGSQMKSGLDVSFAKVNLAEAKLLLSSAENEAAASLAELSAALGYSSSREFELEDAPAPPDLVMPLADLTAAALRHRPDAAALREEQNAAQSLVRAERSLRFPTISALASVGVVPGSEQDQLRGRYGALGFNVNFPILNGRLYSARRTEAEFRAQAAQKILTDLENRIARDVHVALLNAHTARERVDLTAELLSQASQALDLAQTRYDLGLSSIVELSQAQLNQTSAQIASVTARYDYQLLRAVLSYQLGEK
jgi:outer membrane protein